MLEQGADVNAKDKGGLIPLHNASSFGVRALIDSTSDVSPPPISSIPPFLVLSLTLPPSLQHVDVAAMLIKYDSLVNATDRWNFTPLHEAAQKGRTQLCSLLILHGADVLMQNQEGKSPYDLVTVRTFPPPPLCFLLLSFSLPSQLPPSLRSLSHTSSLYTLQSCSVFRWEGGSEKETWDIPPKQLLTRTVG